jgi:regulator of RNase E activity RraA
MSVTDGMKLLERVSTPTLTTVLLKKGLRNVWIRGARPLAGDAGRVVGPAFTLNFIPAREDQAVPEAWASPTSTRAALEAAPLGAVVVANALGVADAGVFGDILCARMVRRGMAGLVTDGAVRDIAGVRATGLPVWAQGVAAPPAIAALIFTGWNQPIGCGGVAIFPGDVIVADADGAVVVPVALVEEIAALGAEQERLEAWIAGEVERGAALPGLYPPNAETRGRYERERE